MKEVSQVLNFWFDEVSPQQWWVKDSAFDLVIKNRFYSMHQKAAQCELYQWRKSPEGRLAEIILLDQFSRNMFRNTEQAFAYDSLAVSLTQSAIDTGADQALLKHPKKLAFLYMPLMHSESKVIHKQAVKMFKQPGLENNLDFEFKHKAIIDQFGRYPHRNKVLNRQSTTAELTFLSLPGSSF